MKKIFWLAGEKSGDLHASMVLQFCQQKHPDWQHTGIGGNRMAALGFRSLYPFARFNVMGFAEVLRHLCFFARIEKEISNYLKKERPDLVLLVDYPGLNMRIAKKAKSLNLQVLYYICPQFWAWKKKRIFQLRDYTSSIGYILPFEGEFFEKLNIPATYTGHPISEEISLSSSRQEFAQQNDLDVSKLWIGFFPGSRDSEVKKLLPNYLKAAGLLNRDDLQFLVSQSDSVSPKIFAAICQKFPLQNLKIIKGNNYELMKHCHFLCVTSGTATLETAFLGTPFVICYRTSCLNYLIGHYLIKLKWIGLPNLILQKSTVPELIQKNADPPKIAAEIISFLQDTLKYQKLQQELLIIHDILGKKSASRQVTALMEELF